MSYVEAQNILDARRAGADMPAHIIDQALEITGDLNVDPITALIFPNQSLKLVKLGTI